MHLHLIQQLQRLGRLKYPVENLKKLRLSVSLKTSCIYEKKYLQTFVSAKIFGKILKFFAEMNQ